MSTSSPSSSVELLWKMGHFSNGLTSKEVTELIREKWGHNFLPSSVNKALSRASFLRKTGKKGQFGYVQKVSPKSQKIERVEDKLFSNDLINKFGDPFKTELEDLHLNFGNSGICTAFLLRKILEKAIFLVFAKNGLSQKLEKNGGSGRLIGLEAMIDTAAREKIGGTAVLLPKTAENVKSMKFLGDTAAHNPLTNVDMETILPQMPYIITAYKELAERL